jgi:type I restriction enzyme S subunit
LKLQHSLIGSRYAEWALRGHPTQRQIVVRQRQAAQPNLFQSEIAALVIPLPPAPEQTAISRTLDALEHTLRAEEAERNKFRLLKNGLMEDLLSGRIRASFGEAPPA